MRIAHYRPAHPLLTPLIAGIYLLEREPGEPPEQYLAFPGIHHFVTINRSAVYQLSGQHGSVTYRKDRQPSAILIANFDRPRLWSYEGPAQEWNICFKPLAINYFLDNRPQLLGSGVTELDATGGLGHHLEDLYSLDDPSRQVHSIENYWLSRLTPFRHPFLTALLEVMLDDQGTQLSFSELAARFNISRTTLHTEFKRYVGIPPARFQKIARFRQALSAYRHAERTESLTSVSAKADYFDQSHMIRDFQALTGYTPKDFFKRVAEFPKGDINWILS